MSELLFEREGLQNTTNDNREIINSGRFAFLLFLGVDVMLFAGLVGGYFVIKAGSFSWPPPATPMLDTALEGIGTVGLLSGSLLLALANRSIQQNKVRNVRLSLCFALATLTFFLIANVMEWDRLLHEGLTVSSLFGGMYFVITGVFLLHAAAGMGMLTRTILRTSKWKTYTRSSNTIPHTAYLFYFLTAVWLTLYALIYL